MSIFGRDAQDRTITISITGAAGAGTFNVGLGEAATVVLNIGSDAWASHRPGSTGSVVINTLQPGYMIGTYDVTLGPLTTGAVGTKRVVGTFTGYFGQT
jgi:hypothetical protein